MQDEQQTRDISIYVPELKQQDIITCYAQLRPFRQGGPRIEKETLNGKTIIHNYGHGGAGVSLAPATSHEAIQLGKQLIKSNTEVAIIGSGVVGLLTAYVLRQKFCQISISIYAQQIPKFGNKNNNDLITSEVAPGYWLPYDYGLKDKEYHNRLSDFAFRWYQQMSLNQKFIDSIKQVEVYSVSDTGVYEEVRKLTDNLMHTSKQVGVILNGKTKLKAHVLKTLKIDMQSFLNVVIEQLKKKQVKFINKKIAPQILPKMSENIIFNCSGLGSRQLFGDTEMKGLKGHLIQYRNRDPAKYNYFLKASVGEYHMAYYMHASRILIGRVVEHEENRIVNDRVVKEIKNIHQKVLERFGLKQTLAKL